MPISQNGIWAPRRIQYCTRSHLRGGGGGGGGFSPNFCGSAVLGCELAVMAGTCAGNLGVVFGPCVQHCPCGASERGWSRGTGVWGGEMGLGVWFHSIRLGELVVLVCSFVGVWWGVAGLWPWGARAPGWRWPVLGRGVAVLATFFGMWTSDLFCPLFALILMCGPSLESVRPKSGILFPERLRGLAGVAMSRGPVSPECHSPGGLLLLHFSASLSGAFGVGVNVDFAHTDHGRFLVGASEGILSPKSKKSRAFFGFLARVFFGGLNQESAVVGVCGVRICIDSGGFGRIRWGVWGEWAFWWVTLGRDGVLGCGRFGEFLEFFWG